jgi:hypothetical protein
MFLPFCFALLDAVRASELARSEAQGTLPGGQVTSPAFWGKASDARSNCVGAVGSRGRQGAGLCRGTPIVSTTIPLDRLC